MTNLPARLSTLQGQITALTEKLSPCGVDEVGKCIASLMDAGLMIPASIQSEDPIEEYRVALKGVPLHGLRTAFVRLKRGEYDLQNRAYLPIPSEMAAMANAEARSLREDRMRASELARAARENAALGGLGMSRYGLKDLRITQEERTRELASQGFVFYAECQSHDEFANGCKRRRWPAGAMHLWAIGQVWAPGVAKQVAPEARADAA